MTRAQGCIERLQAIYDNISERDLCILEGNTLIKDCKPDYVKSVIKEAINLLNKYDPDWVKEIRGMEG